MYTIHPRANRLLEIAGAALPNFASKCPAAEFREYRTDIQLAVYIVAAAGNSVGRGWEEKGHRA